MKYRRRSMCRCLVHSPQTIMCLHKPRGWWLWWWWSWSKVIKVEATRMLVSTIDRDRMRVCCTLFVLLECTCLHVCTTPQIPVSSLITSDYLILLSSHVARVMSLTPWLSIYPLSCLVDISFVSSSPVTEWARILFISLSIVSLFVCPVHHQGSTSCNLEVSFLSLSL